MGVMPGSRRTNGIKDLEKQCPHRLKIEIVKKNYQVKYILANEESSVVWMWFTPPRVDVLEAWSSVMLWQ
jgi:hypothetical protein